MDNEKQLKKYMNNSVYVWHNMMGGGSVGAFKHMIGGGLLNHYIENDEGFKEFVNAQDPLDKLQIVKKYRKDDSGWQYADTDDQILEKFKMHQLI